MSFFVYKENEMRMTDTIVDLVEEYVMKHRFELVVDWDAQLGLVTQGNQNILMAQIFLSTTSPLLGQGEMVVVQMIPVNLAKNEMAIEDVVRQGLESLREQRGKLLGLTN
jgi:hypothetical protein